MTQFAEPLTRMLGQQIVFSSRQIDVRYEPFRMRDISFARELKYGVACLGIADFSQSKLCVGNV